MAFGDLLESSTDNVAPLGITLASYGSGNLLVAVARVNSNNATVTTPPSGFTLAGGINDNAFGLWMYYKIASGSEGEVSITLSSVSGDQFWLGEFDMDGNTSPTVNAVPADLGGLGSTGTSIQVGPANTTGTNFVCALVSVDGIGSWGSSESWDESLVNQVTGGTTDFNIATKTAHSPSTISPPFTNGGGDETADEMSAILLTLSFAGGGPSIPVIMHHRRMMGMS